MGAPFSTISVTLEPMQLAFKCTALLPSEWRASVRKGLIKPIAQGLDDIRIGILVYRDA
jgi:hypothetical protein